MRKITLLCLLFIAFFGWQGHAQTYCEASTNYTNYETITNVVFAGIVNNTLDNPSAYTHFTDQVANIGVGDTHRLSVEIDSDAFDYLYAFIDWNQNGTLDDEGEVYTLASETSSNGPHKLFIDVPADAALGNTRMRIKLVYNEYEPDPCGSFDYGEVEDYTLNVYIPTCPSPSDLTAVLTTTTADLNWIAGDGTTWNISWGLSGYTPGDGNEIENAVASTASYQITSLTADTAYDIFVQADCGAGDTSAWRPLSILTEYCHPVLNCEEGDNITNVTFEGINNTTTCSSEGEGDFTSLTTDVTAGESYPISVTVGGGWETESVSVWIDFDHSLTFDQDEFFYIGTGSAETLLSTISIPEGLAAGQYRMRVRVAANPEEDATWDLACDETQGYGETEDYTLNVVSIDDNVIPYDNLGDAIALTLNAGCSGDLYSNVGATAETGEPAGACWYGSDPVQASVWFSFVAPSNGNVRISTDIGPADLDNSQIAVYGAPTTPGDVSTLPTAVGCNEVGGSVTGGYMSVLTLNGLTPGATYYIQVDGYDGATGGFCITVDAPTPTPTTGIITNPMIYQRVK